MGTHQERIRRPHQPATHPQTSHRRGNGYATGGGCEIALACHLIVADTTATFAPQVRVGLIACACGLVRLPRAIPSKLATEMILSGRRLTAEEALHHGLVNRVSDAGTALDGARALAEEILAGSPTSVRASLQVMDETAGIPDTVDAIRHKSPALGRTLLVSQDMVEGLAAFAQKGHPTGHETEHEGIRSGRSWVTGAVESVAALDTSAGPPGLAGGGLSGRPRTPEGSRRPV